MGSKQSSGPLPRPRLSPCGFFLLIIIAAAFGAGNWRQELALSLVGAVCLSVWMYCLILGLVIAMIHRKKARSIRIRLVPRAIAAGGVVEIVCPEERFFRIPGILARCRVRMETRDGRRVEHTFDPGIPGGRFDIPGRGAYYAGRDELAIFDAFGIFDFSWALPAEAVSPEGAAGGGILPPGGLEGARVLASPRPAEEPLALRPRTGGREQHSGPHYRRTDDLIDHRPYIPGDDPRRINWKLYSHGPANSLFVREGETEPPPRARLLILADTEADPGLFSPQAAREAVDLLCEQVLAISLDLSGRGMEVLTGYTGGALRGGDPAELARAMAWPAALPLPAGERRALERGRGPGSARRGSAKKSSARPGSGQAPELPAAEGGTCILALPRTTGGQDSGALDRFLSRRAGNALPCDIIFLYTGELREEAETCARIYGARNAVRAFAMEVSRDPRQDPYGPAVPV
jgi:hypothetical protein